MTSVELPSRSPLHRKGIASNSGGGVSSPNETYSGPSKQTLAITKHNEALQLFLDKATSRNLGDFNNWLETTAAVEQSTSVKTQDMHNFEGDNGKLLERNNSSYTYQLPQRDSEDTTIRYTQFVSNWVQTWNYLMITDGDYFECENPLFTACCNFYFHFKIMRLVTMFTAYVCLLYLYLMAKDPSTASVSSGPFIANILFLGAYLWGASIYKGGVFRTTLMGDETRLAREKITILSSNSGKDHQDITGYLDIGCPVLVKSYQDGDWVRGTVLRVNSHADNGVTTYDIQYLGSRIVETGVRTKYLRLREGSSQSEVGMFGVMLSEYFISVRLIIISVMSVLFPEGHKEKVYREKSRRAVSSVGEKDEEVEQTRSFFCGCLKHPMLDGKLLNEDWPRPSTTDNGVANAIDMDFTNLKDEVLKHYLDDPMDCGYWELLDWAMKYMRGFANQKGTRSSLNKSITRALTVIVVISPFVLSFIYIHSYFEANSQYNLWGYAYGHCQPAAACEANFYFMIFSGVYSLLWLQQVLIFNALFTIFIGLLYGADAAHTLTRSWQSRFRGLRRIGRVQRLSADPLLRGDTERQSSFEVSPGSEAHEADKKDLERLMLLIPFIKRDAFERYLLIYHFVDKMSDVWGGFLLSTILLSLLATGFTYYLLVISTNASDGASVFGFVLGLGVSTVLFIWPVWCLVQANTGVDVIAESFQLTAPDDYMLLGDRETWRTFSEEAPLYWNIMGVPITQKVLMAYYSTAGTVAPVVTAMLLNAQEYVPSSG